MEPVDTVDLVSRPPADSVLAWRDGRPVSVAAFVADVEHLAACMPPGRHVLNVCRDRYRFLVGFAAAALSGRVNLLPSTRTAQTVRQLRELAPDAFCLTDHASDVDLPRFAYPERAAVPAPAPRAMPAIERTRVVAQVFTSGSTGVPQPHPKTWGALADCVRDAARLLELAPGHTLVATVPPQHMYGLESSALIALHGGVATSDTMPFYPADIVAALEAVPAPRLLVTSPVHLRALLDAGVAVPPLGAVLCATAPLPLALAAAAEAFLGAPLLEIYGSTETGQIALRQPLRAPEWELFPGVRLSSDGTGVAQVEGGHVQGVQRLHDVIEPVDARRFRLHGRGADMVNIAGKRSSLSYLDHQLLAIPGVRDAAFYLPDDDGSGVTRLIAFAVAEPRLRDAIVAELRARLDPAFMPRPPLFVDALPRNATGKLPRAALRDLIMTSRGAAA